MKKETTPKKTWKKPEVQDLDVKNTEASKNNFSYEIVTFSGAQYGPAS